MNDSFEHPCELVWPLLSAKEQESAIRSFWTGKMEDPRKLVTETLCGLLNFRPQFFRTRPLEWKVQMVQKHVHRPPLCGRINYLLQAFLIENGEEMITAILDAEGTTHTGIWIDKDAVPPTVEVFKQGLASSRGRFRDRDLLIYYSANLQSGKHWEALWDAMEEPDFTDLWDSVLGADGQDLRDGDGSGDKQEDTVPESSEAFTTLDNQMIQTVVATATASEGALSPDELEDMILELIALNSKRHRSHFHLGFLDAVLNRELRKEIAGSNVSRRGWYFTGYLMGRMRLGLHGDVVETIEANRKSWDELLDSSLKPAHAMLVPSMIELFIEKENWRLLVDLLRRARLPQDRRKAVSVAYQIYQCAADLVRKGLPAHATPLLDVLLMVLSESVLPDEVITFLGASVKRKLGQAHLREGRFGEAKGLLRRSLEQEGFAEAANARADLGLAEAGFRSLDFVLPKNEEKTTETTIKALEKRRAFFEQALTDDGRPTNAHFVLGLIAFHRARPEAEQHLIESLAGMMEKEAAYQSANLLDWNRFLLAIIVAEQCEPARLNELREALTIALESPAYFPLRLWRRWIIGLSVYDDKSLAETAIQHLLDKRGDDGYQILRESDLFRENETLRRSYRQWLGKQKLSPKKRAAELEVLLDAALADPAPEELDELLDSLEGVAKCDSAYIDSFLKLLGDRRRDLLVAWSENEIDNVVAALLERKGRREECFAVLQQMINRAIADDDWPMIEGLLPQIEQLKLPTVPLEQLHEQVEHLRPSEPSEEVADNQLDGVCVLYVGGHQAQQRYQKAIEAKLAEEHPGLNVTFYFPGWDSNVGAHMETLRRMVPQHNVVVINNFVRTNLGRQLRSTCDGDIPWRACTGHGRESLTQSIVVAARWIVCQTN